MKIADFSNRNSLPTPTQLFEQSALKLSEDSVIAPGIRLPALRLTGSSTQSLKIGSPTLVPDVLPP